MDQAWAVFDVDDAGRNDGLGKKFLDALMKAKSEKVKLAISNEVFELWLLLHFTDVDGSKPYPRSEIYKLLEESIRKQPGCEAFEYNHGKPDVLEPFSDLGDEAVAMQRATLLEGYWTDNGKALLETNPVTRVHLLVKELRDLAEYFADE